LLNQWIRDAEALTGAGERRIGWLLASTVVIAALQRALGVDNAPLFLVKGGVYMELQLGLRARATKDIDTLFRGTAAEFNEALGEVLADRSVRVRGFRGASSRVSRREFAAIQCRLTT
jgi:hypothetical protein